MISLAWPQPPNKRAVSEGFKVHDPRAMKYLQIFSFSFASCGLVVSQFYDGPSEAPLANTPDTPYGVDWQTYFRVNETHTEVSDLPQIYAGSVSVNRTGHVNNTLFFIGFEKETGSLTAGDGERGDQPWMIYIAGGPGSAASGLPYGATGPVILRPGRSSPRFSSNQYARNKLVDIFYVDQPVGVGYSTVSPTGYIKDEDQMGEDFVNFLRNLVLIFPSLKSRPLYLLGESYGGVFVPYISKAIFGQTSSPVNLSKIIIGEGAVGSIGTYTQYPSLGIMQTYPQLVDFDPGTYEYFVEQYNLCGYNMTLQYPASSPYPPMRNPYTTTAQCKRSTGWETGISSYRLLNGFLAVHEHLSRRNTVMIGGTRLTRRQGSQLPHLVPIGRINPEWECEIMQQLIIHATTTLSPWKEHLNITTALAIINAVFDSIQDRDLGDVSSYFNDPSVRAAYHAPDKIWRDYIQYPFDSRNCASTSRPASDPSIEPITFLSDLANKVPIVFFAGAGDANVGHRSTELAIQNFTFGGIRGFTMRPSTPFSDSDGNFAGIVHSERNVTYALFKDAGHIVAFFKPNAMYTFLKEFVLGTNQTGYLAPGTSSVVGGVHTEYLKGILTGYEAYTGSAITQGTYTWPSSLWNAWGSYMATRTAADVPAATLPGDAVGSTGAGMAFQKPSLLALFLVFLGLLAII